MANGKYMQGGFIPRNLEKYAGDPSEIFLRSGWEFRFATWADRCPSVLKWGSERIIVPYISPIDGRYHRYFVDFWLAVRTKDGSIKKYMVEIKPYKQSVKPDYSHMKRKPSAKRVLEEETTYMVNMSKWEAARRYAKEHGFEAFKVLTENELGIAKK